jgi:hypothetical protein
MDGVQATSAFGDAYLMVYMDDVDQGWGRLIGEKKTDDYTDGPFTEHWATFPYDKESPQGFGEANKLQNGILLVNYAAGNDNIRGAEDTDDKEVKGYGIGRRKVAKNLSKMDGEVDQGVDDILNGEDVPSDLAGMQVFYDRSGNPLKIHLDSFEPEAKKRLQYEAGNSTPVETETTDYAAAAKSVTDIMAQDLQ